MVKIHGEEMPGDVESIGAEGGVADMDEIEEILQLTLLLYVEQDTGITEVTNDSNRLDLVAQLVEHWTSKPKVAGSIPTVVRLIFQLAWCGIYTQSNNTLHILHLST